MSKTIIENGIKVYKNHFCGEPCNCRERIQWAKNHERIGIIPQCKLGHKVKGKNNPFSGKHHTKKSIEKMRKSLPDRKGPNNSNFGQTMSEEQKEKLRGPRPSITGINNPNYKDGLCYHRKNAKRKDLGFEPLNKYFKGSEAHHIDHDTVIFIPKKMHTSISIWHRQSDKISMSKINKLALRFYSIQWFKEHKINYR